MTCSNDKQDDISTNNISPKYYNSELNIKINESDDETFDDNKDTVKKCIFHTKDYDFDSN